jgi:hypothetical protein
MKSCRQTLREIFSWTNILRHESPKCADHHSNGYSVLENKQALASMVESKYLAPYADLVLCREVIHMFKTVVEACHDGEYTSKPLGSYVQGIMPRDGVLELSLELKQDFDIGNPKYTGPELDEVLAKPLAAIRDGKEGSEYFQVSVVDSWVRGCLPFRRLLVISTLLDRQIYVDVSIHVSERRVLDEDLPVSCGLVPGMKQYLTVLTIWASRRGLMDRRRGGLSPFSIAQIGGRVFKTNPGNVALVKFFKTLLKLDCSMAIAVSDNRIMFPPGGLQEDMDSGYPTIYEDHFPGIEFEDASTKTIYWEETVKPELLRAISILRHKPSLHSLFQQG